MKIRACLALTLAFGAACLSGPPAGAQAVDLLLALCVDGSGSIDEEEFRLQRGGYAQALTDPKVLAAVRSGPHGAIAVAYVEWGTPGAPRTVIDWTVIKDQATAEAWADRLLKEPRRPQSYNAIGDALAHATAMIRAAPFKAERGVIDLSGDGPDLRSLKPAPVARDEAVAAGITINALAIFKPGSGNVGGTMGESLDRHYERAVIGGPGAFVQIAENFKSFGEAILQKLVREIASLPSPTRTADSSENR
jgi:hypothetical protein